MRNKLHTTCKNQYFENPRKISSFDGDHLLTVTTLRGKLTIKKHTNVLTSCMFYYKIQIKSLIYIISLLCK